MFVAAIGFGPLAGILALATHSTGRLGKFFAETLEHVDMFLALVSAINVGGARRRARFLGRD